MAERYGTELAEALPEADAVVGFAGEGSLSEVVLRGRKPSGVRDLLELPRPGADAAVGVREGGRGLRPGVRVLRDPVVPRQAAVADDRLDRGRGARPGRRRRRRDRARRAGPRLVRARHRRARLARAAAAPARPRSRRTASRASACSTSTRARCATRSLATMLELPTVVPYFDLSLQHASAPLLRSMKRWGSGDRFVDLIARIRADEPDGRVPVVVHRRLPGRDRVRPRRAARRSSRDGAPRLGRLLPVLASRTARRRRRSTARSPTTSPAERLRECSELQDPITQAARDALVGETVEVLVDGVDAEHGELVGRTHREAPEIDGVVHVAGDAFARPGRARDRRWSPTPTVPTWSRAPRRRSRPR